MKKIGAIFPDTTANTLAFFLVSISRHHTFGCSRYYEIFFCTKGESCEINLTTRKSCQFCRFKKCLEAGMRIAWVLPDGERHRFV